MKRIFFLLLFAMLGLPLTPLRAQQESGEPIISTGRSAQGTFRGPSLWGRLFGKPAAPTPSEQFALAERLETEGQFKAARRAWESLFLWWPLAPEAPEAVQRLAELLAAAGKNEAAFQEYQYLLDLYGSNLKDLAAVIARQMELANTVAAARSARWLLGGFPKRETAIPLYLQIASNAPRSSLAFEAGFKAAQLYEIEREPQQAIALYYDLLTRHPSAAQAADIPFRILQAQVALCRRYPHDQNLAATVYTDARRYLQQNPQTPHAEWLRETIAWLENRLAHALIDRARIYERAGRTALAIPLYEQCIQQFPKTTPAEKARLRLETIRPLVQEPRP